MRRWAGPPPLLIAVTVLGILVAPAVSRADAGPPAIEQAVLAGAEPAPTSTSPSTLPATSSATPTTTPACSLSVASTSYNWCLNPCLGNPPNCIDTAALYATVSGGSGSYSFSWTGEEISSGAETQTVLVGPFSTNGTRVYSIQVLDLDTGCTATATGSINADECRPDFCDEGPITPLTLQYLDGPSDVCVSGVKQQGNSQKVLGFLTAPNVIVSPGDSFSLQLQTQGASTNQNALNPRVELTYRDGCNGPILCEAEEIHTSCSQPLFPGMTIRHCGYVLQVIGGF